jgi:hypothetical protein
MAESIVKNDIIGANAPVFEACTRWLKPTII